MQLSDRLKQEGSKLLEFEFQIGDTTITAERVVTFVLIVVATIWISRLLQRALRRLFKRRAVTDEGSLGVVSRLVHYLVLILGFGIGLHNLGINLTGFFAAGALFAVGIGFAMQNLTENFVSGVILLLERTIKPGDVIELNDRMIKVTHLGIRATEARSLDDEDLIVPNSQLVQSVVKNYTLRDRLHRLRVVVGVTYGSDMAAVRSTLEQAAESLDWRARKKGVRVLMTAFADSSVNYEVSVWIEDPWNARQRLSDLHEAIWWAFKDTGIVIAFPQLDVHFDPPVTDSLQNLREAV